MLLFDGAGLGLFAVAGTQKALIAGLNPVMAIFMGVLTGIGGGILRDVLVNQTPTVLQADIYAVAALAAGVVVAIGHVLHYPAFLTMTVGALLCFWLRGYGHIPRMAFAQTRVLGPQSDAHRLLISPRLRHFGEG